MKNKFTKMISFIMSAVMTVSTLTTLSSSAEMGYEAGENNRASAPAFLSTNKNLFGSLKYTETDNSVNVEDEASNPDYTVYKVEHDRATSYVGITYHAKEDCILFLGIYNDEGTELYTSMTKELESAGEGYAELTVSGALPDHYLVKAFLVGKMMQDPLSKPAFYNKETKVMQEILSKTTDDFDDDNVVNLDQDEDNNFFVLQDDVIEIKTPEIFIKKEDDGRFTFKKCDDISVLKKGDKAVVYTEQGIVSFIVEKTEISDDTISITPADDADVGEIFKFIKIDTDETTEYTIEDESENTEDQPKPKSAPQDFNIPYPDSPKALDLEEIKLPSVSTRIRCVLKNKEVECKDQDSGKKKICISFWWNYICNKS